MRFILAWPLWTLRNYKYDDPSSPMVHLLPIDVAVIIAMVRINAGFIRWGKSGPDPKKNGEESTDFSAVGTLRIAKLIGRPQRVVQRSVAKLKKLKFLKLVDGEWMMHLPSPTQRMPFLRIDAAPIEEIWDHDISFNAKLAMTFRWLYRKNHGQLHAKKYEKTFPSVETLAKSCRLSWRVFYMMSSRSTGKKVIIDGINEELRNAGLMKKKPARPGKLQVEEVRVMPRRRADAKPQKITGSDFLDEFNTYRSSAGLCALDVNDDGVGISCRRIARWLTEIGCEPDEIIEWAHKNYPSEGKVLVVLLATFEREDVRSRFLLYLAKESGRKKKGSGPVINLDDRR